MQIDPDQRTELAEAILNMLIDRGMSQDSAVAVIPAKQVIDALLKVAGFLIAQSSPPVNRCGRRRLLDYIDKYLDRQIVGYQQLTAEGRFNFITPIHARDVH